MSELKLTVAVQDQNPRHTYISVWQNGGKAGVLCVESDVAEEVMARITSDDAALLDGVQAKTTGYGQGWLFRESDHGRGWRLHETTRDGAVPDVRQAISDGLAIVDAEFTAGGDSP